MHLRTIKLTHFKNYAAQTLELSPRLNCFTGLNGMGKTNLLDAVHYLCLTKSHRGVPDKMLVRHDETFFRIEGMFEGDEGADKVVAKYLAGQRKEMERNGSAFTKLTEYIGTYPVVMVAPDDVTLVQDGSEERRRFLDNTLSQISQEYLHNLLIYNNLIKQRNSLLKRFAETRQFDPAWLEALDRQLPGPARVLYEQRAAFTASFSPLFAAVYRDIAGGRETAAIAYESDLLDKDMESLLRDQLEKDRLLERTGSGPHRDDVALTIDGYPVKKFASQGQIKSFLLALRLAQYERLRSEKNAAPILLLDDIFDKLDEQRVRSLIGLLIERQFGQIFITDTQRGRMESVIASFPGDYKIFDVTEGVATSA